MITGQLRISPPRLKTFSMTGGLNTQIANYELKPGELISCKNYVERQGDYSGYQSTAGYERFDGQTAASDVSLETYTEYTTGSDYVLNDRVYVTVGSDDLVFYCQQASGSGSNAPDSSTPDDNTWWVYEGLVGTVDILTDRKREAQREVITAVGDTDCTGAVYGVHIYADDVYAWRSELDGTDTALYKSTTSGWSLISGTSMTEVDCTIKAINSRFSLYNSNGEAMFWIDGKTQYVHVYNGTAVSTVTPVAGAIPINIGVFRNRLFVIYSGGHILFSTVGDPTNYDTATGLAGEIYIGDDVNDVVPARGNLLIFTRNKIQILQYGSSNDEFIFKLDEFTDNMGGIANSISPLLGAIYFADDRGISKIGPAPNWDGLLATNIGKHVESLFNANKANITGSAVDRDANRYYLFYTSGGYSHAFVCTFNNDRLKGITRLVTSITVNCVTDGTFSDGTAKIYIGGNDGYVYEFNSGTSFDGDAIDTEMTTSNYHYGSPRYWKNFQRLHFEIACDSSASFTIGKIIDYGASDLAKTASHSESVAGGASTWGSGIIWGSFAWGSGSLGKAIDYIQATGVTMAIKVSTSSKYSGQHTIHNVTVDYIQQGLKQ